MSVSYTFIFSLYIYFVCVLSISKEYSEQAITYADYTAPLTNTPTQTESLLHSLKLAEDDTDLHFNANILECMCLKQKRDIFTLNGGSLKLVDKFTCIGSSVSSTENEINVRLAKPWTAIDRLSIIWKSNLSDKKKHDFYQAAVVFILLYGCISWTLTECIKKKLDENCTRMVRAILNKSSKQHIIKQQLYGQPTLISKTTQVRWT